MQPFFLLLLATQIFTLSHAQTIESHEVASPASPAGIEDVPAGPQGAKAAKRAKRKAKQAKAGKKGKAGKRKAGKNVDFVQAASFLSFDPPLLELKQFTVDEIPVAVSLDKAPTRPVSVYVEAPNMIFSECKLDFTPENWNQKRTIKVSTRPYLAAAGKARNVQAKFCYCDKNNPDLHNSCQYYPIRRKKGKGCRCSAIGDPHYTSFKRQKFDFQGKGAFYLVNSDTLSVQQFNSPFNTATAETKVAVRYYNTVYVFDGKTKTAQLASEANEGVQITEVAGVHWRVATSDGSVIRITHGKSKSPYLGTIVALGQKYTGRVTGLCGKIGAGGAAKGQAVESAAAAGPGKWRVPGGDDMFKLGAKASSVVASVKYAGATIMNTCKVPDLDTNAGDGTNNCEQGETTLQNFHPFQPMKDGDDKGAQAAPKGAAKAPTKAWLNAARTKCTALMTIKHLNAVINPKPFVKDCVKDCIFTKSYDNIEDAKRAYLLAALDYINSAKAEPVFNGKSPAAQKLSAAVTQACNAAGLGNINCPNNCSNHGQCTAGGCACNVGFTGLDCGREVPQAPPADKSYTDEAAPPEDEQEEDLPEPAICGDVNKAIEEEPEDGKGQEGGNEGE